MSTRREADPFSTEREAALIAWLALEREAVWFFPYAGARVTRIAGDARKAAAAHAAARDRLLGLVQNDTTTVQPTYDVGTIDSVAGASAAARLLERRVQAACLAVVAASSGASREVGVTGLQVAALAELGWSGRARAFPGMAD